MATGKPCKNTLYFGCSCSYLKNKPGDPNFFYKSDQQAKMKVSKKCNRILWSGFRATLNFPLLKVALNRFHVIVLKVCRKFHSRILSTFQKYKVGSPSSFLRYRRINPKYRAFFHASFVTMVIYYVTLICAPC